MHLGIHIIIVIVCARSPEKYKMWTDLRINWINIIFLKVYINVCTTWTSHHPCFRHKSV